MSVDNTVCRPTTSPRPQVAEADIRGMTWTAAVARGRARPHNAGARGPRPAAIEQGDGVIMSSGDTHAQVQPGLARVPVQARA
jgi:hypothetical protein